MTSASDPPFFARFHQRRHHECPVAWSTSTLNRYFTLIGVLSALVVSELALCCFQIGAPGVHATLRTTNKKYYKKFSVPDLERCGCTVWAPMATFNLDLICVLLCPEIEEFKHLFAPPLPLSSVLKITTSWFRADNDILASCWKPPKKHKKMTTFSDCVARMSSVDPGFVPVDRDPRQPTFYCACCPLPSLHSVWTVVVMFL